MILTCPQCSSRYLLSAHALAPEGRKVKCSGCGEVWHQDPDASELTPSQTEKLPSFKESMVNINLEFRDIPESVKPLREGTQAPVMPKSAKRQLSGAQAGYAFAVIVFCLLSGLLVLGRQSVVDHWLPSALLFDTLGLPVTVPGEGLMFDVVTVTAEPKVDAEVFNIEGRILNITPRSQTIPYLYADIRDSDGGLITHVPITLEQKVIETGQSLDFKVSTEMPSTALPTAKASEVRVHISLQPEIKS